MKGIVFNVLEQVVSAEHGEETWETLLEQTGLVGAYTSVGSYPAEDLIKLAEAAAEALSLSTDEVIRWFGRSAMPLFAERFPALFAGHESARAFVLTLNDIIHPEVRKLYPGAVVPEFEFDSTDPEMLVMSYYSPRKLCAFAEGLLLGSGDHFGQPVSIEQPRCLNRGDQQCQLEIRFSR